MIHWKPFIHDGREYELSHLHPETWAFEQAATDKNPARIYKIRIIYSLHCFTTKKLENNNDISLNYSDSRELRTFCFARHTASYQLQSIIRGLGNGYVFHTGEQNFLRIDNGAGEKYEVFFVVTRSRERDLDLQLYVQSSYVRTRGSSPKAGKIRFSVVAYNTLQNKKIKPPRR
jgi:hypothetical protein